SSLVTLRSSTKLAATAGSAIASSRWFLRKPSRVSSPSTLASRRRYASFESLGRRTGLEAVAVAIVEVLDAATRCPPFRAATDDRREAGVREADAGRSGPDRARSASRTTTPAPV